MSAARYLDLIRVPSIDTRQLRLGDTQGAQSKHATRMIDSSSCFDIVQMNIRLLTIFRNHYFRLSLSPTSYTPTVLM